MAKNTVLPPIIGLPPGYESYLVGEDDSISVYHQLRDTMPLIRIRPATQDLTKGLEYYTLVASMDKVPSLKNAKSYKQELMDYYEVSLDPSVHKEYLSVAFLAQSPVSESFTNDFGESMFQGMTDVASKGVRELTYASGLQNMKGFANKATSAALSGMKGLGLNTEGAEKTIAALTHQVNEAGEAIKNEKVRQSLGTMGNLLLGHKLDFPQIWQSSSWSPSFSIQVRLYNPNPGSEESTKKFIVAPLAALMMFVVPRTNDGHTYYWPWLCMYDCPGLFDVQAGYIKSISVVKGGDDFNIGFNQVPGIVDVKIDFGTLYSTMISRRKGSSGSSKVKAGVPTLQSWLKKFLDTKKFANGKTSPEWWDDEGVPTIDVNNAKTISVRTSSTTREASNRVSLTNQLINDALNGISD